MFTLRCLVDDNTLDPSKYRSEHGVSFSIESPDGHLLFDTGQSGKVLTYNAKKMRLDLHQINTLVLSHAHYDHTGGLETLLRINRSRLPLYAHPDLFRERFSIRNDQPRSIGMRMSQAELTEKTILHLSAEPMEVLPGVWTTGEIRDRLSFEGRSVQHFVMVGETWQPDPYKDDLSIVMQAKKGLVVLCGCCHAGLLNTLSCINRCFLEPIQAIVGGAHLITVGSEILGQIIQELPRLCQGHELNLYLNHCTGKHALSVLRQAFGDKSKPCPAGTVLVFD